MRVATTATSSEAPSTRCTGWVTRRASSGAIASSFANGRSGCSAGYAERRPRRGRQGRSQRSGFLVADVGARDHRIFAGAWDSTAPPIGMFERMMGMLAAHDALPSGDFRDWTAIDTFARAVAGELELARDSMTPRPTRPRRSVPAASLRRAEGQAPTVASTATGNEQRDQHDHVEGEAAIALPTADRPTSPGSGSARPPLHPPRARATNLLGRRSRPPPPRSPRGPRARAPTSATWSDPRRASPTAAMRTRRLELEQRGQHRHEQDVADAGEHGEAMTHRQTSPDIAFLLSVDGATVGDRRRNHDCRSARCRGGRSAACQPATDGKRVELGR